MQQRCDGIEIDIGRYFNGHDWVWPVELNVEHKDLCVGNLGPKTWKMGALMGFAEDTQPLTPIARFGVIVLVAVPPFPYQGTFEHSARDTPLLFRAPPTPEEWTRLHLEEVWHVRRGGHHRLATDSGFALRVSGAGATAAAARTNTTACRLLAPLRRLRDYFSRFLIQHFSHE